MSREGLTEEVLFELGIGGCVVTCQVEKQGIYSCKGNSSGRGELGRVESGDEPGDRPECLVQTRFDPSHCRDGLCRGELGPSSVQILFLNGTVIPLSRETIFFLLFQSCAC